MKARIDKSQLMKRAWANFRQNQRGFGWKNHMTFSSALRMAWRQEKREAAWKEERESRKAEPVQIEAYSTPEWDAMVAAHYANARPGQYFGD